MPRTYVFSVPIGPAHIDRLADTLLSLAAQSVPVRVALCDASGSEACKEIADRFPDLIAYRRHGPDQGQSDAINEGWRSVEGDVYSWLNADDYLAPDALSIVEDLFEQNPEADLVYGQSLIVEEDGTYIGLHPAVSPQIDLITRSNIISQPSCFYKRALIEGPTPVRVELDYTMDWDLWVRFFNHGRRFVYTPETLSTVLWERGTKTSSVNKDRMREIRELTARNHGWYVQAKTMIGFYQHYLSEYSALAPLVSKIFGWRQTGRLQRTSCWVAQPDPENRGPVAQAEADGAWQIKFYHFSDAAFGGLAFAFFEPVSGTITINGQSHHLDNRDSATVEVDIPTSRALNIEFAGPNLSPEHLNTLRPVLSQ